MFDFTNRVKKVINEYAPKEAKRLGHEYLGPEHVLLGMLKAQDSVAIKILQNLNVDLQELKKEIEKRCEQDSMTLLVDPSSKDKVQKILEYSREEARKLRHSYIGSEHILLAILRDTSSIAASSLSSFSITYQVIRNELNQSLGLPPTPSQSMSSSGRKEKQKTPLLDEFARNLNQQVTDANMDPVIGREKEIERVIQILSRKTKNNPILIGEAGVGKTALVEGLAQRIVKKEVPESMFDFRVCALDVAALIAGTKYRGEFEDRIKKIMKEISANSNIILFIDEVHTIIGAGAAEGAVDAANILKPALARGEIQCIGATTLKEYKKYIERDSALERRFQSVMVDEPSVEDAIRILAGLRFSYEDHHNVKYSKEAVLSAVRYSDRFITDRYLPDKAIDIIDEAGSKVRLKTATIPPEVKEEEKKIQKMRSDKNDMVRLQEYEKAAQLRDKISIFEKELEDKLEQWRQDQREKRPAVTEEDVFSVVSEWTGIPLNQMKESETKRLRNIDQEIAERVVGQKSAIAEVGKAVRRARTGLKSRKQPNGTFIFLGPTGVGKTELAKALTEFLFGDEDALIRFDMSEYMEMHSVSKFIGSPPGYVGYEEGGHLTEAVRRKPYSILLFDEIEKAHPDIQNILLQVLDEGSLTDTMGHKVDFKETIIIMTSNLGARQLQKGGKVGFGEKGGEKDSQNEKVMEELKRFFSPEFLNRIDEIIFFEPLKKEEISDIVYLSLEEINKNAIHKELHVELTESAVNWFVNRGYSEKYGARPIKRLLQKEIEDELSILLLDGKVSEASLVKVSAKSQDSDLTFKSSKLKVDKLAALKKEYLVEEDSIDDFWDDRPVSGAPEADDEPGIPARELAKR
jgi:ATP-dependent Clp protease ATP-binding subunit ClpC